MDPAQTAPLGATQGLHRQEQSDLVSHCLSKKASKTFQQGRGDLNLLLNYVSILYE